MASKNVFVLNDSGHIALARSIIEQSLFLGWGKLISKLATPTGGTIAGATDASGTLVAGTYGYKVAARNDFGKTAATAEMSITLSDAQNAVNLSWSNISGATGYSVYRKNSSDGKFYLIADVTATSYRDVGAALGTEEAPTTNTTSDDAWTDTPPAANPKHTKLYNEVGRRKAVTKRYVVPNANGDIDTGDGNRYSYSDTPTRWVYLQVAYALTDAADQTIYQLGVFVGTVPVAGQENNNYLLPNQVQDPGTLFSLSNISPIYRNAATREIREIVITF